MPGVDGQPDRADQPGAVGDDEPAAAAPIPPGGGGGGLVVPPPWDKEKDRPSVLDAERLMRRHRAEIQRLLSEWLGDEGEAA